HAYDDRLARLDGSLLRVGALRDGLLEEAVLDGARGTTHPLDLTDQRPRLALDPLGQRLYIPAPPGGIDDLGHAGLVGENLLGPQRERSALLRGQRQRLVDCVGVVWLGGVRLSSNRLVRLA